MRVAGLKQQVAAGVRTRSADGLTPREQLAAIAAKVVPLAERHARMFTEERDAGAERGRRRGAALGGARPAPSATS